MYDRFLVSERTGKAAASPMVFATDARQLFASGASPGLRPRDPPWGWGWCLWRGFCWPESCLGYSWRARAGGSPQPRHGTRPLPKNCRTPAVRVDPHGWHDRGKLSHVLRMTRSMGSIEVGGPDMKPPSRGKNMADPTASDFGLYCVYCGADYDVSDGFYCSCQEEDDDEDDEDED